ncbi:hypothetical protein BH23ACT6_BH23ACT6_27000 [soil metagenome]
MIRREPLHPGAQQTFDDEDGYRFTAFLTDQPDTDLAVLDQRHRAHARVEQRIRDAKDTGLANLPSADFAINTIWLQLVLAAQDLLAFFAGLSLDGELARAAPATLRYRLLHVAGRSPPAPGGPPFDWTATGRGSTPSSPPSTGSEPSPPRPEHPPILDNRRLRQRTPRYPDVPANRSSAASPLTGSLQRRSGPGNNATRSHSASSMKSRG